jgi:hypothetical protein
MLVDETSCRCDVCRKIVSVEDVHSAGHAENGNEIPYNGDACSECFELLSDSQIIAAIKRNARRGLTPGPVLRAKKRAKILRRVSDRLRVWLHV